MARFSNHPLLVAFLGERLAAFLIWRRVAPGESEILHIETLDPFRRRGCARALLQFLQQQESGDMFLEVRESNIAARNLYKGLGFLEAGRRRDYYPAPPEDAIVMKFHSC